MTDALTALRLQLEWGADEALGDAPVDRFAAAAPAAAPEPVPAPVLLRPTAASARATPQSATLETLLDEWDAFGSPLRATATRTVHPAGNRQAQLVLIGDAPGSDDDRSGQAFSGPQGQILGRVFATAGLDRETMLLTTLVPWRPPGGRPLSETEILSCLPFVRRLLSIVRPERLILVGAAPLRHLAGETGALRSVRGRWLSVAVEQQFAIPALPLPAIDQWLRSAASKQQLWSDLIALRRTTASPANQL